MLAMSKLAVFLSIVRWPLSGLARSSSRIRRDYGEQRFQAIGYIDVRLHVLVFPPRGRTLHVISLRKANSREVKRYEAEIER